MIQPPSLLYIIDGEFVISGAIFKSRWHHVNTTRHQYQMVRGGTRTARNVDHLRIKPNLISMLYPLVDRQYANTPPPGTRPELRTIANWKMALEIVDFPISKVVISYQTPLPEGSYHRSPMTLTMCDRHGLVTSGFRLPVSKAGQFGSSSWQFFGDVSAQMLRKKKCSF